MLTLYYKQTCAFSQRVLGEAEDMGVKLNLKDISSDSILADELMEKGGKTQVPFLVDEDRDVSMYESGDIIEYLKEHYPNGSGKTEHNGVHIHNEGEVCDTCQ